MVPLPPTTSCRARVNSRCEVVCPSRLEGDDDMRFFLHYLIFAALLSLGPSCLAQAVTIRVVNANNGRPLRNQQVVVSLLYEGGEAVPEKYDAHLSFHTDANGEVRFELPKPAPGHISAQVQLDEGHWQCFCGSLASTQELIHNGIVLPPGAESGRPPVPIKAVPGKILFLPRPLSFWLRLLYPLMKE